MRCSTRLINSHRIAVGGRLICIFLLYYIILKMFNFDYWSRIIIAFFSNYRFFSPNPYDNSFERINRFISTFICSVNYFHFKISFLIFYSIVTRVISQRRKNATNKIMFDKFFVGKLWFMSIPNLWVRRNLWRTLNKSQDSFSSCSMVEYASSKTLVGIFVKMFVKSLSLVCWKTSS